MREIFLYLENHVNLLSLVSSFLMLLVTSIYAIITWRLAKYSKQTLLESIKQSKEERQPYIVPTIDSVEGCAFDASTYTRVQLCFHYTLENVGDSSAVKLYTFLYSKLRYCQDGRIVYAHLMPEYYHSLCINQKVEQMLHFETNEFHDIIDDLEICYVKNVKRIETDPTITPFLGPTVVLRCLYMNMMGQWFESVLEQELLGVRKEENQAANKEKCGEEIVDINNRVIKNKVADGDEYIGDMINPGYSKLSRKMVDINYVEKILNECQKFSDSKLELLKT